ncbi:MAG: cache domain-containing protein, partial [Planctomycetota bacterium]
MTPSNLRILLSTMFWPLLIFILVVVAFWGVALPHMRENLLESQKQRTKVLTSVVHSIIDKYHQEVQDGDLTRKEAQNRAAKRVSNLRYGAEKRDYFWINDLDHNMIVHPYMPELEEENLYDYEDPNGKKLLREMVEVCKKRGGGFVRYHWQ